MENKSLFVLLYHAWPVIFQLQEKLVVSLVTEGNKNAAGVERSFL